MSSNATLNLIGNVGASPVKKQIGKREQWTFGLAVNNYGDEEPTWYGVRLDVSDRADKLMNAVTKGSRFRVTGNLRVNKGDKGVFLDVFTTPDFCSFEGGGGKRGEDPAVASSNKNTDIPF